MAFADRLQWDTVYERYKDCVDHERDTVERGGGGRYDFGEESEDMAETMRGAKKIYGPQDDP